MKTKAIRAKLLSDAWKRYWLVMEIKRLKINVSK